MGEKKTPQEAEEQAIRTRIAELQQELETLQARLHTLTSPHELSVFAPVATTSGAAKKPMDPLDQVAQLSRGSFFFAPKQEEEPNQPVALWLRMDPARIAALGESPDVEFRGAVFAGPESEAVLLAYLVRFGPEEAEDYYETWIDATDDDNRSILEALANQDSVEIRLYGDECRLERVLEVDNRFKALAYQASKQTAGARGSSADRFHEARTSLYKQYPTVRALWRGLKP